MQCYISLLSEIHVSTFYSSYIIGITVLLSIKSRVCIRCGKSNPIIRHFHIPWAKIYEVGKGSCPLCGLKAIKTPNVLSDCRLHGNSRNRWRWLDETAIFAFKRLLSQKRTYLLLLYGIFGKSSISTICTLSFACCRTKRQIMRYIWNTYFS